MSDTKINVEVAYALANEQVILSVQGDPGMTIEEAITKSGILGRYPQIEWPGTDVGVFGKIAKPDSPLVDGDRVEIYRPLIADPKEMRKKRAAEGKVMRRGGGEEAGEERAAG